MKDLQVKNQVKLNSSQVFLNFSNRNICFQGASEMLVLNSRNYNCNKEMIIYDRNIPFLIKNVKVIGFLR